MVQHNPDSQFVLGFMPGIVQTAFEQIYNHTVLDLFAYFSDDVLMYKTGWA